MRKRTAPLLSRPALLCAALALGPGCKSVEPQATRPSDGAAVGGDTGAASAPDASTPETGASEQQQQGTSPWQRARVGDRVTYSFSANRGGGRTQQPTSAAAGVVTLEVVAVEAPWVWLSVSLAGDGGAPLPQPRLARSLVVPVRTDVTRTLEAPREGEESTEQSTAAGRTWEAKRYLDDQRMADGPLQNRLYAVNPGPLYLTNGLLDASTTLSGFGASGGTQLTLMEVRQGAAGAGASTPSLALPLGPGTWYDVRTDAGGAPSVQRTCLGAERGFVLRQVGTPAQGAAPCADFSQAEALPLEEVVLSLVSEAVGAPKEWPPRPQGAAPAVRDSVAVGGKQVPALRFDVVDQVDGSPALRATAYAADPWDGALAGLAHEARFQPLSDTVYRTTKTGQRQHVEGTKLVGFGAWVPGARP